MKICFIADANSIHAQRWIDYFCKPGNEVFILSTTRNPRTFEGAVVYDLYTGKPATLPRGNTPAKKTRPAVSLLKLAVSNWILSSTTLTNINDRITLMYRTFRLVGKARNIVKTLQPDILHCLRLPIEGYIGGMVGYHPLIVSSWGNDFVYFASKHVLFRWLTWKAMRQVDAYLPDTTRDKYISVIYGFSPAKPTLILPVIGGLKLEEFPTYRQPKDDQRRQNIGVDPDTNLLIMTRDFKSPYANPEALIKAMPQIVKEFPNTICILIGNMLFPGYRQLRKLAGKLEITKYVRFLNWLEYGDFIDHVAAADVMVSVGLYDGLPASLLEGMVCGTVPVMSNDFPIQEWITDGWNGYLFDPRDPGSLADAVIRAFRNKDTFETMRERNWDLLADRADYHKNMKLAEELYCQVIERNSHDNG